MFYWHTVAIWNTVFCTVFNGLGEGHYGICFETTRDVSAGRDSAILFLPHDMHTSSLSGTAFHYNM